MSDIKPTLSDIKVALVMGFSMFDGQDAGDALDDYIAEVRADEREKAADKFLTGWKRLFPHFSPTCECQECMDVSWLADQLDPKEGYRAMQRAARGEGTENE